MKRILEKCPNCDADLSRLLFRYFHGGGDYSMNFQYECECGAIIDVTVEVTPLFLCALAESGGQSTPGSQLKGDKT